MNPSRPSFCPSFRPPFAPPAARPAVTAPARRRRSNRARTAAVLSAAAASLWPAGCRSLSVGPSDLVRPAAVADTIRDRQGAARPVAEAQGTLPDGRGSAAEEPAVVTLDLPEVEMNTLSSPPGAVSLAAYATLGDLEPSADGAVDAGRTALSSAPPRVTPAAAVALFPDDFAEVDAEFTTEADFADDDFADDGDGGAVGLGGGDVPVIDAAPRFDLDLDAGVPLATVLATLARVGGVNVVAGEDVTGTVTATLHGVTAEEVLTALGRAHGFTHERSGNMIFVRSLAEVRAEEAARRAEEAAARRAEAEAEAARRIEADRVRAAADRPAAAPAPVEVAAEPQAVSRLYRPHYVSAADVAALVASLLTPGVGVATATAPPEVGLPLDGANAGGDSLTQRDAVLVRDLPEVHEQIVALLEAFDVPPAQVAIEAVILRVALNDSTSLGVNFALLDKHGRGLAVAGAGAALAGATGIPGTAAATAGATAGGAAGAAGAAGQAAAAFGTAFTDAAESGLRVGTVRGEVSSFVEALERFGTVSAVATPSVRVLNKQRGEVVIGQRLGYRTQSFNGTQTIQSVQFIDAGTKLVLRPFVAPDGLIRLEIHPELSTGTIDASGVPQLNTTEVTTNVMARDGQTVLIAGLIDEAVTEDSVGIPGLGSLPWVGGAFRQRTERISRSELVVLLTPRIVREPEDAARGAWLKCRGEEALARAKRNVPHDGRVPRAERLYAQAVEAFCENELRKAWRLSSEAVRLNPTEARYADLRRDVAASLAARGDDPPPFAAHPKFGAGDWTDPAFLFPGCGPGCGCEKCEGWAVPGGAVPEPRS